MNLKEKLKANKWYMLIWGLLIAGTSFLGFLGARIVPVNNHGQSEIDTIYVGNGITDSLLKNISIQVNEINKKISTRKSNRKWKPKKDTIRIDASIHVN